MDIWIYIHMDLYIEKYIYISNLHISVRNHSGGSMKLNACILLLAHMVIYNLNTV